MTPRLDFEPPLDAGSSLGGTLRTVADGVDVNVLSIVVRPAEPEETILETDMTGLGVAEARDVVAALSED
jgi:hypothetical protein